VKLVACSNCKAQYDLDGVVAGPAVCPCGATLPTSTPPPKDLAVTRCSACGALVGESESACAYCRAQVTRRPEPGGPVCPQCYARNPQAARHCVACGVEFLPQPARTRSETLECPVCPGMRFVARNLGGYWVEECPSCLGLWAPGDVMDRLVERVRQRRRTEGAPVSGATGTAASAGGPKARRAAWQSGVTYRRCPECHGAMQRRNFARRSGVVVDWCGHHGSWLDAHEMEDIAAFVLNGGLDRVEAETAATTSGERAWQLPADPNRTAAILAAERILTEERARSAAADARTTRFGSGPLWRGVGDLLAELMKGR
jgi:Zn-finger nucleic acid-binding protein